MALDGVRLHGVGLRGQPKIGKTHSVLGMASTISMGIGNFFSLAVNNLFRLKASRGVRGKWRGIQGPLGT